MSFALGKEAYYHAPASGAFSLAGGALHEFYASAEADGVSLSALAMMLGLKDGKRAKLWVRHEALVGETGTLYPVGLTELGFDPACVLLMRALDVSSALQAGLDGARCAALGAVIIEIRGEARAYDLTASRRLALAAKTSGVPVFLLRIGAKVAASAAETRWLARTAPSQAIAAKAPGPPAFHLTLLRARNGQEGVQHHLEWNRDGQCLENRLADRDAGYSRKPDSTPDTPLPGAVVPVSFNRPGAPPDQPHSQAG
jgi:protein ImuA